MKFSEADGLRIGLWGAGRETASFARAAATHLPRCEIAVVATDRPATDRERSRMPAGGLRFAHGEDGIRELRTCDLVVRSPGVSIHRPDAQALRASGIETTTATSLWLAEAAGRSIVAVTGTKGKSTTASLIAHALKGAGATVELAGNVGRPALDLLDVPHPDHYVIELSSFQIADLATGAGTAVFTNIYREHLDWHGSEDAYVSEKLRLAELPGVDTVVFNARDERLNARFAAHEAAVSFGAAPGYEASPDGVSRDGALVLAAEEIPLLGEHNFLNVCAALTTVEALGVAAPPPPKAVAGFRPLPHRLEHVASSSEAMWINDSISTTPKSTLAAVQTFAGRQIVLIAGGYDRQQDYRELGELLARRSAVVIGLPETGRRLVEAARAGGAADADTREARDLVEAVAVARRCVKPGGVVLLSPGAPSFGAYTDFEERGEHFRSLVLTGP